MHFEPSQQFEKNEGGEPYNETGNENSIVGQSTHTVSPRPVSKPLEEFYPEQIDEEKVKDIDKE